MASKIGFFELPGLPVQLKMAPPFLDGALYNYVTRAATAKKAAVMLLCYPVDQQTHIVMIHRNAYPGVHANQVGFPGGRIEPTDADAWAAALREAEEEIGLEPRAVQLVAPLSPLYIPPSDFMVTPFLALCTQQPHFVRDPKEVKQILQFDLHTLFSPATKKPARVMSEYQKQETVPSFSLQNSIIWGASAMMLEELRILLK